MFKKIALSLLVLLVIVAGVTAHPYHGLNTGVAWGFGGVEISPEPAVFLCSADFNTSTGATWNNPLADLFPSLVADC